MLIGRTVAEAPILWPHDSKSWLIGKNPDAGQDWRQKEKRAAEDELVGWHHQPRVWANSGRWWRTGKPAVLQSMGLQRVRHNLSDWTTTNPCKLRILPYVWEKTVCLQLLLSVFRFLCEVRRGRLREIWFPQRRWAVWNGAEADFKMQLWRWEWYSHKPRNAGSTPHPQDGGGREWNLPRASRGSKTHQTPHCLPSDPGFRLLTCRTVKE